MSLRICSSYQQTSVGDRDCTDGIIVRGDKKSFHWLATRPFVVQSCRPKFNCAKRALLNHVACAVADLAHFLAAKPRNERLSGEPLCQNICSLWPAHYC